MSLRVVDILHSRGQHSMSGLSPKSFLITRLRIQSSCPVHTRLRTRTLHNGRSQSILNTYPHRFASVFISSVFWSSILMSTSLHPTLYYATSAKNYTIDCCKGTKEQRKYRLIAKETRFMTLWYIISRFKWNVNHHISNGLSLCVYYMDVYCI